MSRPGEITIPELTPGVPDGPFMFIITKPDGSSGRVTLNQIIDFIANTDNASTALFAAIAKIRLTKAQFRAYNGTLFRVVYLLDVIGPSFAVYSPGATGPDNADDETSNPRIIIDGSGRRYQLMTMTGLWDLMLANFLPEQL